MSSESELIKALESMVITADPVIEYRLYYNEDGDIIACSMQEHLDLPNYVVVDKTIYEMYHRYRVINSKVVLIEHNTGVKVSFVPSSKGFRVVKNNIALLLTTDEVYNDTEYYDYRNN